MTIKAHLEEENHNTLPMMSDHQILCKTVSDVTNEKGKFSKDLEGIVELDEAILLAECDCCGLKEDCTKEYISKIRNSYSGKWVCGLCSEAVKERQRQGPSPIAIEEAVTTHTNFVQEFNSTTRLNPKLSLTYSMKDIAKRSGENRNNLLGGILKITRSSSCSPRIDLHMN